MKALGVTGEEIDIKPAAMQMLKDIGHPFADGEPVYDVTFENVQAGLRTDYLFRLANQRNGVRARHRRPVGAGARLVHLRRRRPHEPLQRERLGVPKTLIQYLIRWVVKTEQFDADASTTLLVDPRHRDLARAGARRRGRRRSRARRRRSGPTSCRTSTSTTSRATGCGRRRSRSSRWHAWRDAARGALAAGFPGRRASTPTTSATIKKWLGVFLYRFFEISQFKRSALPNGPKVVSGGTLSPRGDWRAPSDGNARVWLDELAATCRKARSEKGESEAVDETADANNTDGDKPAEGESKPGGGHRARSDLR